MTPHARLIHNARHTRKTLYLVAGFYVVVGFGMALVSAVQGDRLGTFLGFLIISGALTMGLLFRAALHLGVRISGMGEGVDEVRRRLERMESLMRELDGARREPASAGPAAVLDLSRIGSGDPSVLAAATLDRDVYPRLVATMEEEPPAQADGSVSPRTVEVSGPATGPRDGLTSKNLLRQWKVALRDSDLAECRRVLSAMIDTAGPEAVEPLRTQIAELADRVERTLREEFSACVRSRDYASALAIGERMIELIPERPVAEEFARLRPLLERREAGHGRTATAAPSSVR